MIEQITKDLFRMEIPLPRNPLRSVNSYVIRGRDRNLIIDTGLNREECLTAFTEGIKRLGVDLENTDFFITHMHADHFALAGRLAPDSSIVYFSSIDAARIEKGDIWRKMEDYAALNGFPEAVLSGALKAHPGYRYGWNKARPLTLVKEGDIIQVGDCRLRCIITPGHTPGHLCLFEASNRMLFSGDHILEDITPNIQCWSEDLQPLRDYLGSLEKTRGVDADLVLPGHRRVFNHLHKRIDELKEHHRKRASEALDALKGGPLTAYEAASRMSWDIDCRTWEEFPPSQKWFATGEAIAHLRYLEEEGLVERRTYEGVFRFAIKGGEAC
jgi:glyoxylase-like metal-dependent hydrolase (beta-lactamase superfamily II)